MQSQEGPVKRAFEASSPSHYLLTPRELASRFGLSPHETWLVLFRSELRTHLRRGHQVVDVRTFVAAWLDAATAPPNRKGGHR
ncbi:MAG: hypothetical protein JO284_10015 [Planctomycetaceae bacterium]|nr:hypothetical protein [Planctomycetaceae bacterium]MBV8606733.1 hypothetical protein [Singulisphaera sp.]MBV8233352.1 hypothetical protein [Planctomycetaceae bacterium]MBV8315622.1 hypothetical protein [Planctomycetaceae bacterium]MBV8384000.1 hypothetical protein [Planctomycetaceae bacterium]